MKIRTIKEMTGFIKRRVDAANANGVVLGVSGGVDSAVCLALAVKALGKDNVHGLVMPDRVSIQKSENLARDYLEILGVKHEIVEITASVDAICEALTVLKPNDSKLRHANIMARVRMICLYDRAKRSNRLVLGTDNRTENILGYYTVWGDGAFDLCPISCLYKTEVYGIAWELDVPEEIIKRKPSAELWDGQTDEEEIGMKYGDIDAILMFVMEGKRLPPHVSIEMIGRIVLRAKNNEFKSEIPYGLSRDEK